MKNKQEPATPSVVVTSPPRVAVALPPPPVAWDSLSPPSPPSRLGSLFPWLGLTLVVALLTVVLVRQEREMNTAKTLSEPTLKSIKEFLEDKVNTVKSNAAQELEAAKATAKEKADSANGDKTKLEKAFESASATLLNVSTTVGQIKTDAAEALQRIEKNVDQFSKAKDSLDRVTDLANPLGPKMESLTKSFSSLQNYLESLQEVNHEAVIVVCNGGDPTPGRLAKGLKDFVVSCPFPKLYKNYHWTILEKHGTHDLVLRASSLKPDENMATVFKLDQSSDGAVIELGKLDDELSEWYKKTAGETTAAKSNTSRRVLTLLISQSTQFTEFVRPSEFQSLNVLLCINRESEPDKLKMLEWMELCQKNDGAFDYVRLPSSAPAASAPASSAVSTKGDDKQAAAPTQPNAAAPTQPNAAPPSAAAPATPNKAAVAATTASPAEDPQARLLQFLLRVCQPLPNSR